MHTMCLCIILFSDCNRTYQNRPSILLYSNLKGYNIPEDGSSSALQTHHYGYGIKPIICFNKYITTEAPAIDITYLRLCHGQVILFHSFGLWLFIQSLIWTATVKIKTPLKLNIWWVITSHHLCDTISYYRQVSNIRRTKSQHLKILVPSCGCLCRIPWSQMLSREWRCSWSSADRRCSNYIWVIDNFIAY